jgi:alkylation response protein AidB-like acyl-CoA dehydrogenase
MNFEWTAEESARYSQAYSQARQWPTPGVGFFSPSEWKLCASLGFPGLGIPEIWQGGPRLSRAAESALDAVRIFGGDGIRSDRGIERELRDVVPSLIFIRDIRDAT